MTAATLQSSTTTVPATLQTIPVDAPIERIFEAVRRDGGVIIKNFMPAKFMDRLNEKAKPQFEERVKTRVGTGLAEISPDDVDFYATHTTHLRGLLGRLPEETTEVIRHPVYNAIMDEFLSHTSESYVADKLSVTKIGWIVSNTVGFMVRPGAQAQVLHRDQIIHNYITKGNSLDTAAITFVIAGTNVTEKNGATRVIPGSHLWDNETIPKPEQTSAVEMEKGSAAFWLGSLFHGGGCNAEDPDSPDATRILYNFGCCQDIYRQEENQMAATPPEIAKALPRDVLTKCGWAKTRGGGAFVDLKDPLDFL